MERRVFTITIGTLGFRKEIVKIRKTRFNTDSLQLVITVPLITTFKDDTENRGQVFYVSYKKSIYCGNRKKFRNFNLGNIGCT